MGANLTDIICSSLQHIREITDQTDQEFKMQYLTLSLHLRVCPGIKFKVAPSARKSLLYSAVLSVVFIYHSTLTSPRLPPMVKNGEKTSIQIGYQIYIEDFICTEWTNLILITSKKVVLIYHFMTFIKKYPAIKIFVIFFYTESQFLFRFIKCE